MRFLIFHAICYALLLVATFLVFYGLRNIRWVKIDHGNRTMEPEYPGGTYQVTPLPPQTPEIRVTRVYAYYIPGKPYEVTLGYLVAREGQKVEWDGKALLVDGSPTPVKTQPGQMPKSTFVVPKGCGWFLASDPRDMDSVSKGPIPLRFIYGTP